MVGRTVGMCVALNALDAGRVAVATSVVLRYLNIYSDEVSGRLGSPRVASEGPAYAPIITPNFTQFYLRLGGAERFPGRSNLTSKRTL